MRSFGHRERVWEEMEKREKSFLFLGVRLRQRKGLVIEDAFALGKDSLLGRMFISSGPN